MKALIICSVHAICDISSFERTAFNAACARHGIPAILTAQDFDLSLATTSIQGVLNHLPGSPKQRRALSESYLDLLNEAIWSAPLAPRPSVLDALRAPGWPPPPTGFVSDYPLLTTNLIRAAALGTDATKLGALTVPSNPVAPQTVTECLMASATSLGVDPGDVDVLVAHRRDYSAARSLGMRPRLIAELRASGQLESRPDVPSGYVPAAQSFSSQPVRHAVAMSG